ncbi:glycosyl transferase family 2 family protein [Asticcacaulis biprosthecium C19]|uniref:Glycosyl transferase family 2 family protein n=1 Tax=Asticcacaulis biprosthecium C19 TaxID=715226 RepID=F4QQU9_9CAUL|nr:glycosyltransferase family 2 protein [Asticcacaulis biprosthecium]EGF90586.1 glycosyl transferase family 2 family protein [Asticcacaulis biprosthecium C19]
MPATTPLSCCIIARNEGDRIGDVIRAVAGLVDEVVVIDSGSTDNTVAVAEGLGARVVHHDWPGYGPQKRYSEDCAAYDWILNLDADEVVTPELYSEIKAMMREGPKLKAYRFRIMNVYPGRDKPRLWADFHNYVRLYDRRVVRFRESPVHDTVDTRDEPVGQLTGTVTHFSSRSFDHIRQKFESYNTLQAKVLKKPSWQLWARLPLEYPLGFLRYYVFRRHFTGGFDGVRVSHIAAEARFKRILKFLAAQRAGETRTGPAG